VGLLVTSVADSYRHARAIARERAKNFYYSFVLLDRQRRDSLCAIYAFMRHCDDLSDEKGASSAALERWRQEMVDSLGHRFSSNPLWPGFADTVERYRIPHQYLHEMIDGVASDLTRHRFETFDELYRYCYQVASVAGLCVVHIFGFRDARALVLAEKCGVAFQLTNILRDAGEDYRMGRIYLPRQDRERFAVEEMSLGAAQVSEPLRALLAEYARRARGYYGESRPLLDLVDRSCRSSLWALMEIYSRVLGRIEARRFEVLKERVRLSALEKSRIVASAIWQRGSI
jgi:15-cis-phytoene synthase